MLKFKVALEKFTFLIYTSSMCNCILYFRFKGKFMKHQFVLILDFGGQYNQVIARRVRELGVYCEVYSYKKAIDVISQRKPDGIIFTGGPNSVYSEDAPKIDDSIFKMNIPILGICYGAQMMALMLGGQVKTADIREYGKTSTKFNSDSLLFEGLSKEGITWMSHTDYIVYVPDGFKVVASSKGAPVAAMENRKQNLFAVQFHPEVSHTVYGKEIIKNFLVNACNCGCDWTMKSYLDTAITEIRDRVKDGKVLLALSGGVDSSVLAALLSKSIGNQLTAVFVDHGFMRKNEGNEIEDSFRNWNMNFVRVDASDRFLKKLSGIVDPEQKRKLIGEEFIRVFEEEAKKIGQVDFLAQGTIYPDIIESGLGDASVIKSHHNVGGLPDCVDFKDIVEPLRMLFKDEVRQLGAELGLADVLINRQPFPGPGLAIRIIGDITRDKLDVLKNADYIFREEIANSGLDKNINQYFAVLTSVRSVGVMGDSRTYDYTLALRGVTTTDFMTADFARIPYELLEKISVRIVNEVNHINRVVYDITTKPPATIEFE